MNKDAHINDTNDIARLGRFLKSRREALGLSARVLAQQADIDKATVTRLELGQITHPRSENIKAIAQVLRVPVSDLFAVAGWMPKDELPSLRPYLRTKYNLTAEEAKGIEEDFARIASEKGISFTRYDGPLDGEDEG
ncbi:helix-turn-helix domain-containing protein [Nocardia amamiensis]|uniref:Helix-turn-helix domain-containing protein n=1 Tax=Nocardia amamiensis TaxID=404578 RepID=A0ABS0CR24_9NOCA|nr:helix-turn-helix transcriptional regulator [Nocardia amamiensis]MBF6299047.1 helix-turn-helix domain-containing protein [Nocardia amamiensis]